MADDTYDTAKQEIYPTAEAGGNMRMSSLRNPPVRKILETQIAEFEKQIAVRKDLLTKLDNNKGVEEVLDALRKVGI